MDASTTVQDHGKTCSVLGAAVSVGVLLGVVILLWAYQSHRSVLYELVHWPMGTRPADYRRRDLRPRATGKPHGSLSPAA